MLQASGVTRGRLSSQSVIKNAVAAWNVVYEIAEMIGTMESVEAFLQRVADIIFDHLIVDRLVLLMYTPGTDKLAPQVVRYRSRERGRRPKIVTSQTIFGRPLCERGFRHLRFGSDHFANVVRATGSGQRPYLPDSR